MDYKEKLRLAKEALDSGSYDKETIEYIFPELAEPEYDERIRKALIKSFDELLQQNDYKDEVRFKYVNAKDAIAWLEKQAATHPTDKVKHKFEIGNEIKTANEEPLTITKIDENGYWSEDLFICDFDDEVCWDLVKQRSAEWSEEDEKMRAAIIFTLAGFMGNEDKIDWLKSLRLQSQWKPSDEQITWLYRAADDASKDSRMKQVLENLLSDLKKLKGE